MRMETWRRRVFITQFGVRSELGTANGRRLSRMVNAKPMYSLLLSLIRLADLGKIRVFQFDDLHRNDSVWRMAGPIQTCLCLG
jgi:hypothetical protein